MPAAGSPCDDSKPWAFTTNGECDVFFDWTHDGTSVVPNCNGSVQGVRWENRSATRHYYLRVRIERLNRTLVVDLDPGESGSRGRGILAALGLDTITDLKTMISLDQQPPQAGEVAVT